MSAVESLVAQASSRAAPESVPWLPQSVGRGYAGLALFFGHLDMAFPDQGWDQMAHACLARAANATMSGRMTPGLFNGLAGLAFVTQYVSRGRDRYPRMREAILEALVPQALVCATTCASRRGRLAVSDYDLISGISGIGAQLLAYAPSDPRADEGLAAVLGAIVAISDEGDLGGWYTPADQLQGEAMIRRFPDGNVNCGLAHGIPGPLALLSLAIKAGVEVDGLRAATARLADWLVGMRIEDEWGIGWPIAIFGRPGQSTWRSGSSPAMSKTAWCYGAPGVARSLWLAGDALGEPGFSEIAVEAMESVFRRPKAIRDIDTPTFCHGVAGLLQTTLRFANEMPTGPFATEAACLVSQLLVMYTVDSPLGFTSVEPGGRRVDNPALLDGALGVVLVLLAAISDIEPKWDRLFLVS